MHGTDLGLLQVGDSFVAMSVCGDSSSWTRIYPWHMSWLLRSHPYGGMPSSGCKEEELSPASTCFVEYHGRPTLPEEGREGKYKGDAEKEGEKRSGGKLWLVCKLKNKIKKNREHR